MWHELHGREDGRSRNNIFAQMGLIALLAVFAGDATGEDGPEFAIVYVILFAWFTWQWYVVHHVDEDPRYRPTTTKYLVAMAVTVVAVATSAGVDESARLTIWTVAVVGWTIGGIALMTTDHTAGFGEGVTASLVERFGLVTIIVLGEVVIGVVDGIGDAEDRDAMTIAVGIVGLAIGMGIWWNYFDLLGRRVPGRRGGRLAVWMYVHLPLTMAIAAAGAATVSLVEHADAGRTPSGTAWLLSAAVAVVLTSIALAALALPDDEFPAGMARQIAPTFGSAIVVILVVAAIRPAPLALGIVINVALLLTWLWLFMVFLARGGRIETTSAEIH
jgi:low temperature requirement protein LtrA